MYLQFCNGLGIKPVPISAANMGRYIAFLSSWLCFSSVRQYLNAVRIMHLKAGLPNPMNDNWYISSILKGLRRHKGDSTRQKLPITPDILFGILSVLDLNLPFDVTFWAACVVGFFSFFRKSNLLVPALDKFDPSKHLCRSDVQLGSTGAVIAVRWSKTIQFKQKVLYIPLPRITTSPCCPTTALLLTLARLPKTHTPVPLFCYPSPSGSKAITHSSFVSYLKLCLSKLGLDPSKFSGHSLRRGGVSFAMQCGLPLEWVKMQGDRSSNAVERYLQPAFSMRLQLADTLGKSFPSVG